MRLALFLPQRTGQFCDLLAGLLHLLLKFRAFGGASGKICIERLGLSTALVERLTQLCFSSVRRTFGLVGLVLQVGEGRFEIRYLLISLIDVGRTVCLFLSKKTAQVSDLIARFSEVCLKAGLAISCGIELFFGLLEFVFGLGELV